MILDALLNVFYTFLTFVLSPVLNQQDVVLPDSLAGFISNVNGFIGTMNPIFPVDTLLICLGLVMTIELAILSYKAIMWLVKKIPTIS